MRACALAEVFASCRFEVQIGAGSECRSALKRIETIGHRWETISELNDTNETISNFVAKCAPPRAPAGSREARKQTVVAAGVMLAVSTFLLQVGRQ